MLKKTMVTAGLAGVLTAGALVSSAGADPIGQPTYRALQGTGSDTTQGVLNGLSNAVQVNGQLAIASYDAGGNGASATITTKDPATTPNCTINRPSGSGAGVNTLTNPNTAGCVNFARSSADNSGSYAGQNLTYIPFATDAVAVGIRTDSQIGRSLSTAQLTKIYNCGTPSVTPFLPQFNSGTRKFFLQQLGFADAADFTSQANHTCIKETDGNGNPLLENTGTLITDPTAVVPYAISSYLAQSAGTVPDVRGAITLVSVNGLAPTVLNTASSYVRDVYNVVRNGDLTKDPVSSVFVGKTSAVCSNSNIIQRYGFAVSAACGDTTLQTK